MRPESQQVLQHFTQEELPSPLEEVSRLFYELAQQLAAGLPDSSHSTHALLKLLDAKETAVRAVQLK